MQKHRELTELTLSIFYLHCIADNVEKCCTAAMTFSRSFDPVFLAEPNTTSLNYSDTLRSISCCMLMKALDDHKLNLKTMAYMLRNNVITKINLSNFMPQHSALQCKHLHGRGDKRGVGIQHLPANSQTK